MQPTTCLPLCRPVVLEEGSVNGTAKTAPFYTLRLSKRLKDRVQHARCCINLIQGRLEVVPRSRPRSDLTGVLFINPACRSGRGEAGVVVVVEEGGGVRVPTCDSSLA